MPSIQIKSVPDEVHRTLRARAAANGQSLQEYLLALLVDEARMPSTSEWLDRIGERSGSSVTGEWAAKVIREERDRRWS